MKECRKEWLTNQILYAQMEVDVKNLSPIPFSYENNHWDIYWNQPYQQQFLHSTYKEYQKNNEVLYKSLKENSEALELSEYIKSHYPKIYNKWININTDEN